MLAVELSVFGALADCGCGAALQQCGRQLQPHWLAGGGDVDQASQGGLLRQLHDVSTALL